MSNRTKKRRASKSRTGAGAARVVDIISQLKTAARNPLAAVLGAAIGGIVPWFAREIAHGELAPAVSSGDYRMAAIDLAIVLGCVAFSMVTVYGFGRAAVGDPRKAVGFCLALEGVMLVAHGRPATVALVALVLINAVTTGCTIAMARSATQKRNEADGRRSATRAGNRAARAAAAPVAAAPVAATENEPVASTTGSASIRTTVRRSRSAQRAVVVSSVAGASWDRARDGAIDAECVEVN
jgi:hypothetical protein